MTFKPVDEQLEYLRKGAAEIIRESDLRAKLEASLKSGKPLRISGTLREAFGLTSPVAPGAAK